MVTVTSLSGKKTQSPAHMEKPGKRKLFTVLLMYLLWWNYDVEETIKIFSFSLVHSQSCQLEINR